MTLVHSQARAKYGMTMADIVKKKLTPLSASIIVLFPSSVSQPTHEIQSNNFALFTKQ